MLLFDVYTSFSQDLMKITRLSLFSYPSKRVSIIQPKQNP